MTTVAATQRERLHQSMVPFLSFFTGAILPLNAEPGIANFAVGNPQEMPLPDYVAALRNTSSRRTRTGSPTSSASRSRSGSWPIR